MRHDYELVLVRRLPWPFDLLATRRFDVRCARCQARLLTSVSFAAAITRAAEWRMMDLGLPRCAE